MKKLIILFSLCIAIISSGFSQNGISVTIRSQEAPPALRTYVQPPCPIEGYMWSPGYWAWASGDYYWVAGVWVMPPEAGVLWTPGYWNFEGGYYGWHVGYWGENVGYYGGVNYGCGYYGSGFNGGRWEGGQFRYNTAVWHVSGAIHNTYESKEGIRSSGGHASFNRPHGANNVPVASKEGTANTKHLEATREQQTHEQTMAGEKGQFAHANHGKPATHSMSTPGGQRFNQAGHAVGGGHSAPHGGGGGGKR